LRSHGGLLAIARLGHRHRSARPRSTSIGGVQVSRSDWTTDERARSPKGRWPVMSGSTGRRVPGGSDDDLEKVSVDASRWRTGRRFLVAEGVIVGAFGGVGLAWAMAGAKAPPSAGVAFLGLNIAVVQAAMLLGFGVLAVVAALSRWAGVIFTGIAAMAWLVLAILCTDAAVHGAPGALGFDLRDSLVYAALIAYNFGVYTWLTSDALEGPARVRRPARNHRRATFVRRPN
jgi:hypothetical protein